jgi:membrane protease YdiL (CAAX protease family)
MAYADDGGARGCEMAAVIDRPVPTPSVRARAAGFGLAVGLVAVVFAATALISMVAWRYWSAALAGTSGLSFFVPWAVAIAIAYRALPSWRPPWRGPAMAWRSAMNLAVLVVAIGAIAWLYRFQLERAVTNGLLVLPLTLAVVSSVLLGPAIEEWVFRGVLWRALAPTDPATPLEAAIAVIATSVAFALWHLPFNPQAPIVDHAIFGASIACVRWRFQSLAPGLVLHAATNSLYFVIG